MFREIILPIFRSTRLCVTICGIKHPRCCRAAISWQHRGCNNDEVCGILYRSVLSREQKLAYHCLRFIQQTLLTATQYRSQYLFIVHMFSSVKSHSQYKRTFMWHSVPVSLYALFNPLQHSIRYCNAKKQPARS